MEYWLVENRQPVSFDANLHNSGLLIMHVDDEVMASSLGNRGGDADTTVRGLVVEEADGIGQLLQDPQTTGNRGDDGDPFPGSAGNMTFDSASTPNSNNNTDQPTSIEVSGIGPSGSTMTAFLRAGDPAPVAAGVAPIVINNDLVAVDVEVTGSGMSYGAAFRLAMPGETDITPRSMYWQDSGTLQGVFNVYSKKGGDWDVIVTNPDGQESTLAAAVLMVQIVAAQLVSAHVGVLDNGVEIRLELFDKDADETLRLSRAVQPAGPWTPLGRPVEIRHNVFRYLDSNVLPGRTYYYRVEVLSGQGDVRELYRGSAAIPSRELVLEQNYPNPFNPSTSILFYLPEATEFRLDVFDVTGAHVKTVARGFATAGPQTHLWDGTDTRRQPVGSGLYIYRLRAGRVVLNRKMLLLK
jgi:hypothetical protein